MKKSLTYFTAIVLLLSWFLFGSKKLSWFLKIQAEKSSEPCEFQTIFNFGDSNSDTGSMSAAFYPASLPYGETFFHEGAGRSSDGRLIIDFIAKHLGLPMLSAYINSIGTTYRHGANFAAGSSTIMRQNKNYFDGGSPFTLEIQIGQFIQFKSRTGKFFTKENESSFGKHFPKPEDFSKAIYTFDIGQNDMTDVISKMGKEDSHVLISNIVELFSKQVQSLYFFGAKTFWIHNTGPIGCLPLARPIHNAENNQTKVAGYLDQNGCVNLQNDLAKEFNKKLKDEVVKLRAQFLNASLIYVDMFSAKYELFSNANKSDTGGISAAFQPIPAPYGVGFFHKPFGRDSDGRVILDFIAEKLKLPYLSAYLNSLGTNYRHGANFATGGSTIRRQNETIFQYGISPFSLDMQIVQFNQFKARTKLLYQEANNSYERSKLPVPEEFSKALYTFDIGQNDLSVGFRKMNFDQIRESMPDIVNQLASAVKNIYDQGGRSFWIHNTGPVGCMPVNLFYKHDVPAGYLDQAGCVKDQNVIAVEFNKQLKDRVVKLRTEVPEAAITYVDVYAAKYGLISNTKSEGFVDPMKICCGYHVNDTHIWCGNLGTANGKDVYGTACEKPSTYVSWDGVHYAEAANHWVADRILNGAFTDPPTPISQACYRH